MSKFIKVFFSVSLILFLPLIVCGESNKFNQKENNTSLLLYEYDFSISSLFTSKSDYPGANSDGFFSRLFNRKKKSVAEKTSKSERLSGSKKSYDPPKSNSSIPMGESKNGSPSSSPNTAVQNVPKEPLNESRRDKIMSKRQWLLGVSIGSSHAVADIGGSKNLAFGEFVDYQMSNLGLNLGIFAKYQLNDWFALSFGMDYGSYKGIHSASEFLESDYYGYSFQNDIFEFFTKTEFHAPFLASKPADVYLFTGIGVFFNDMKLYDDNDRRTPPNEIGNFNQTQPAVPIGLGFGYCFSNQLRIGYELGYRYTFFTFFDGINDLGNSYDRYFSNSLKISYNF